MYSKILCPEQLFFVHNVGMKGGDDPKPPIVINPWRSASLSIALHRKAITMSKRLIVH